MERRLLVLVGLADQNERIMGVIPRVATACAFLDGEPDRGVKARVSKAMVATLAKPSVREL
jgi:hypothetical protein